MDVTGWKGINSPHVQGMIHILINYLDKKSEVQSEKVNGGTHALESWVWANSIQAPLKSIIGNHAPSLSSQNGTFLRCGHVCGLLILLIFIYKNGNLIKHFIYLAYTHTLFS